MNPVIHPFFLCGGSGTRLWPLSRKSYPKQFSKLIGEESLYQSTALRFSGDGFAVPSIVTSADYRFIALEQLAALEIAPADILIEPSAKNTAGAICAAAFALEARAPGELMLLAPSDHIIPDAAHFRATVKAAASAAVNGQLVTFGISPNRPETGYGWLALSAPLKDFSPIPQPLQGFVEKPDLPTAKELFASGTHLWNAGIFLFSTTAILDAFALYAPDIFAITRTAFNAAEKDLSFLRLAPSAWDNLPDISIDYAVMERASNLAVMPYDGAWSDLGDWHSVWREGPSDATGVVTTGPTTALDCEDTLLHATNKDQQLVGIGLSNIIAIAMPDAVLVTHKNQAQHVKAAVAALKTKSALQAETLPRDHRPWGWYETLAAGPRFKVKCLVVHPGAALSLQSHRHRSEHWIIVAGSAKVTIGSDVKHITENQSVYIPRGTIHRLENPGTAALTLIEVQSGEYFGEDDIIRYEDLYARKQAPKE